MSKRDELRKLRMEQKQIKPTETPAEEYSMKAAATMEHKQASPEDAPMTSEVLKASNKAVLDNKGDMNSSGEKAAIEAVKEDIAPDSTRNATEHVTEVATGIAAEHVTEVATPTAAEHVTEVASEIATPTTEESVAGTPKQPQTRKSKTVVKDIPAESGKRISVSLINENNNWMRRTSMRCGLSIQDYINILIDEAWAREKRTPFVMKDTDPLPERIPSSRTTLVAIKLSEENILHAKRLRASHCMTMTAYVNYLIQEEMKREEKYGIRASIFDEE